MIPAVFGIAAAILRRVLGRVENGRVLRVLLDAEFRWPARGAAPTVVAVLAFSCPPAGGGC
jgi:hypothetical protein